MVRLGVVVATQPMSQSNANVDRLSEELVKLSEELACLRKTLREDLVQTLDVNMRKVTPGDSVSGKRVRVLY